MRPSPPKKWKQNQEIVYLNSCALSRGLWRTLWHTCHVMGRNLVIGFLDKINLFVFKISNICVCVFCGEYGCIYMISICVADIQLWLLWLNRAITMNANRPLWTIWPLSVWLSSVLPRTSVCKLLTNSNQCECLAKSVYVWQSEYVCEYELAYIQSYFFISFYLLLKLFLLYFLVVK